MNVKIISFLEIKNIFFSYGYNKWHDNVLPLEILEDLCKNNDIRPPKFMDNTIEVNGVRFEDETQIATGKRKYFAFYWLL